MQLTSLGLHAANFSALPPSWTALRSLRKLNFDYSGPPLEAEHALRPLGISHLDMPATPARVWNALAEAAATGGTAP